MKNRAFMTAKRCVQQFVNSLGQITASASNVMLEYR